MLKRQANKCQMIAVYSVYLVDATHFVSPSLDRDGFAELAKANEDVMNPPHGLGIENQIQSGHSQVKNMSQAID